jgi:hypothetical protein
MYLPCYLAVVFVESLLRANPSALVTTVKDIVPAMDGVALADPESWSGMMGLPPPPNPLLF